MGSSTCCLARLLFLPGRFSVVAVRSFLMVPAMLVLLRDMPLPGPAAVTPLETAVLLVMVLLLEPLPLPPLPLPPAAGPVVAAVELPGPVRCLAWLPPAALGAAVGGMRLVGRLPLSSLDTPSTALRRTMTSSCVSLNSVSTSCR